VPVSAAGVVEELVNDRVRDRGARKYRIDDREDKPGLYLPDNAGRNRAASAGRRGLMAII